MRLQFGNLNFSGRGFSNDFSAAAEDHAAASAGYDAGPAAAAAQALAEPAALAPAASSSSAIDAFKAAGARGRSVSGSALSASAQTPAQPCRAALAASSLSEGLLRQRLLLATDEATVRGTVPWSGMCQ